ncbi:hypothetical protein BRADI_2g01758v3, partial [Brachypodium distachyon]
CSNGDCLCSPCRDKLPAVERLATQRCLSMERVVDNIFVPCKHGCDAKITYHQQRGHQYRCPERPGMCKCLVSGCGFVTATEELFDHLTAGAGIHRLPWEDIKYFVPFKHEVRPGIRLLRGRNKLLFLLEVARESSPGHVVSLTFVRPNGLRSTVGCSVFLCGFHHYQVSKLNIGPDVASKQILCVVSDGKYDMASGDGHELEDYQEWDDDGDTTEEDDDDDDDD